MQVLVGGDDGGVDLGPPQQLAMIGRDELGADRLGHPLAALRILLGDADPFDRRMARRHLAAEEADAAGADDGETDALSRLSHACLLPSCRGWPPWPRSRAAARPVR